MTSVSERKQNHNIKNKSIKELIIPVVGNDGVQRNIPALDKHWAQRSIFSTYSNLITANGQFRTEAALDEWVYQAQIFRDDVEFLLRRSHHEFWSYLVYQKGVISSIASFLKNSIPFYTNLFSETIPSIVIALYEEVLNLVLQILLRMVILNESETCWIEKEHLQDILYKKSLLSVPMLFDLLITVGNTENENCTILRRIFDSLLEIEPRYKADIITSISFLKTAFQSIHTQTENEGFDGAGGGNLPVGILETAFDDVVLYTVDCSFTLSALLDICPWIRCHCVENNFVQRIAKFYNITLPMLYENIFYANDCALSLMWLNQARVQFIYSCHKILSIFNEGDFKDEECNPILAECLTEELFIIDFERHYLDIKLPKTLGNDKTNLATCKYENQQTSSIGNSLQKNSDQLNGNNTVLKDTDKSGGAARKNSNFNRDIELEICMVLDCLPHLESDFVRRLLLYYENSEEAIAAILENNLPPNLINDTQLQTSLPTSRTHNLKDERNNKDVNIKNLNISNDDYKSDSFLEENEGCIIKKGKGSFKNIRQIMDDKTEINNLRHHYKQYYFVSEDSDDNHEYEDEYDDSYEAVLYSEARKIKSKEVKNILAEVADQTDNDNDSEDCSDVDASETNNLQEGRSLNFCEDPELIRARYNAQKKNKTHQKSRNSGLKAQDQDISRDHKKKEIYKSIRSNHNRKMAAQCKRSKGMF